MNSLCVTVYRTSTVPGSGENERYFDTLIYAHRTRLKLLNMPYDVVGNAAGFGGSAFTDRVATRSTARAPPPGDRPSSPRARFLPVFRRWAPLRDGAHRVLRLFACWPGAHLDCHRVRYLLSATTDTRGNLLTEWSDAVSTWNRDSEPAFAALQPTVDSGTAPHSATLSLDKDSITPSQFGETSWSTKKIKTPSTVTAETWTGTAKCDTNGTANTPCTITLKDKKGATAGTKTVTLMQQIGPKLMTSTFHSARGMTQTTGTLWRRPGLVTATAHDLVAALRLRSLRVRGRSLPDSHGRPNDKIVTSQLVLPVGHGLADPSFVSTSAKLASRMTYRREMLGLYRLFLLRHYARWPYLRV